MLRSFCLSSAVLCVGVEAGRLPRASPEDALVTDAEVAVVEDAEASHQNTNMQCKARNPGLTPQETKNATFDYWFGWYDIQGCGKCYDYCKWRGDLGGNFPNPVYQMSEYWDDPGPDFPGRRWNRWSCALSGDKGELWTPAQFDRWRFARCSGEGAAPPPQPCWKLHPARHIPWPIDCSERSSASTGPYIPFSYRLRQAQQKCEKLKSCFAIELQPDMCSGGDFRIVNNVHQPNLVQKGTAESHRVWFYSPDCRDLKYKCSLFNDPLGDKGFTSWWRGWYDVQKCGRCWDYCRWVGDSAQVGRLKLKIGDENKISPYKVRTLEHPGHGVAYFSCRLAGSFEDYTPPGYFKSFSGVYGCGWNGRGGEHVKR